MSHEEWKKTALPRGVVGGLDPDGPRAPGIPQTMEEARELVRSIVPVTAEPDEDEDSPEREASRVFWEGELERKRKLEEAQESRKQAELEQRADSAYFRVWLREMQEGLNPEESEDQTGRNALELILQRVEKVNGKEALTMVDKITMSPEEARKQGAPDLEGLTFEAAKASGWFGTYRWAIRGWLKGERIFDTSLRIRTVEPPGYAPPATKTEAPTPKPEKAPMEQITETLTMMKAIREALGGAPGDGGATGSAQAAAALARLEADREHRQELRGLEDRHRQELEREKQAAFERGKAEGKRDSDSEYQRRIWELEREVERAQDAAEAAGPVPDMVDKVIGAIGGPGAVQGIVSGLLSAMAKPKAEPRRPIAQPRPAPVAPRPVQVIQAQPAQPLAVTQAAPVAVNPAPTMPEPAEAERLEAVELLEDAAEEIQADHVSSEDQRALAELMRAHAAAGRGAGPFGEWWAQMNAGTFADGEGGHLSWLELAEKITEEEEPMDPKTLLLTRLEEGATAAAILEEMRQTIDPAEVEKWRGMVKFIPDAAVFGFLGIEERHHATAAEVLAGIKG